jgi:hypothetical protein
MSAEQTIDLTGHGQHLRYVEIHTDAGIIRVNVNLEDTQTRQRVVVVEVEPNSQYRRHTAAGGDWATEVRDMNMGSRTDIRLIRQDVEVTR